MEEKHSSMPIEGVVLEADDSAAKKKKSTKTGRARQYSLSSASMVTKSNKLIQQTRYALPKTQQKILLAMIAQIDPKNDIDANKVYSMSFSDFAKLTGVNVDDRNYLKFLKDTIRELANNSFWMDDSSDGEAKDKLYRWIGEETEINRTQRMIYLQFSPRIFPYLTQLKSNYTSFNVQFILRMNSTYSMRIYELLLSYDNGDGNYDYGDSGVVFRPVTPQVLKIVPSIRKKVKDYKYKVFSIDDLKMQLSPPPETGKDTSVTEKYQNYHDFDRYVLSKVKQEINEMTDLWFEYAPVRLKGHRKYEHLYFFIKYKTREELDVVMKRHSDNSKYSDEVAVTRKRKSRTAVIAESERFEPLNDSIFGLTTKMAIYRLNAAVEVEELKKTLEPGIMEAATAVLTYTARLLTNTNSEKRTTMAHETRDALNRMLESQGTLKIWCAGMARMMYDKQQAGQLKSPQYNSAIVYNALEDMNILQMGRAELKKKQQQEQMRKTFMDAFED